MTDDRKITVSRHIDAPAKDLFALLTLPARHRDFDATGMIVSDDRTQRIQAVGDTFTMNMHAESQGGDYQMTNHVIAYDPNHLVGWAPAADGEEPGGWTWVYELVPDGPDATDVTLTYDWSNVTDKSILHVFPVADAATLEESLGLLAAAVA